MAVATPITEPLIRENIIRAVSDVFTTMVRLPPSLCAEPMFPVSPQVVGAVGFAGELNGLIYLHVDLAFARLCTARLLGMSEGELDAAGDEVVNDAMGELTNMTAGSFKNALCDAGYPCKLTIPSILRGTDFSIQPISSAAQHMYSFQCAQHRITADILIKADE